MSETIADPFAAATDEDDPFATVDDAASRSGPFIPWPSIMDVSERLIVLVPRTFDKEAKVSEFAQQKYGMKPTQEEWRTDLIVLDGGQLSYTFREKDKEGDGYHAATHVIEASDLPALIPGWRMSAGNIIGTLNRIHEGSKPFALGRIRAGYTKKEMDGGKTFEQYAQELAEFEASPRGKKQPKPVWHLQVTEAPADKAVALAWWRTAQANGFKI